MYLGSDADNSPLDVAYDSVNEITLSRGADTLVQKLRRAWIFLLATPIAWAHGQPHAQAMRRNKLRKIADGTATVVRTTHFLLKWPPSSPPGTAPKGFKYPKIQKSTIFTSLAWGLGRPQRVKVPKHPPLVLPLRTALSFRPFYTFVLLYFCTFVLLSNSVACVERRAWNFSWMFSWRYLRVFSWVHSWRHSWRYSWMNSWRFSCG